MALRDRASGLLEELERLTTAPPQLRTDIPAGMPSITPYNPSLVERAERSIAQGLLNAGVISDPYRANRSAEAISGVLDFLPVAGDVKGVAEFKDALDAGNKVDAAIAGAGAAVGLLPFIGDVANAMFIGPRATSFDFAQMRRQQEMEAEGARPRDIVAETGMFRGADGMVRSEISDAGSKATPFPFGQNPSAEDAPIQVMAGSILDHPELYENYPLLANTPVNNMALTDPGLLGRVGGYYDPNTKELTLNPRSAGDPEVVRDTMLHELQHMIQEAEGFAKGGSDESAQRIVQMINERELQDIVDYGYQDIFSKRNAMLDELRELRPAETLYRMQNINRPKDLFNSNFYYQFSDDIRREIGPPPRRGQASLDYAQRAGKVISRLLQTTGDERFIYQNAQEKLDDIGSDVQRQIRNAEARLKRFDSKPETTEALSAISERKRRRGLLEEERLRGEQGKQETYRRFGGEVESRNTETRKDMTMEERLANPYYLTQDIPNREQEMYRITGGGLLTYPTRNRYDVLYPRGILGE